MRNRWIVAALVVVSSLFFFRNAYAETSGKSMFRERMLHRRIEHEEKDVSRWTRRADRFQARHPGIPVPTFFTSRIDKAQQRLNRSQQKHQRLHDSAQ